MSENVRHGLWYSLPLSSFEGEVTVQLVRVCGGVKGSVVRRLCLRCLCPRSLQAILRPWQFKQAVRDGPKLSVTEQSLQLGIVNLRNKI